MNKKIVLTVSGGADSAVLLHKACEEYSEVHTITFDYNQRHNTEISCALKLIQHACRKYPNVTITNQIIDMMLLNRLANVSSLTNNDIETPTTDTVIGEAQPKTYVPFRNLLFITVCCSYAESVGADVVWYGAAQVDSLAGYWDSDYPFVNTINEITKLNRHHRITIEAPLLDLSKKEIMELGVNLEVPFDKTFTCYSGASPCDAKTASSSLRLKGFIDAKYIDPIEYKQQEALNKMYKENGCIKIPYIDYKFDVE
jgi:7-cyano-7-deazaguanine synthase